jgi:hypothetical protein
MKFKITHDDQFVEVFVKMSSNASKGTAGWDTVLYINKHTTPMEIAIELQIIFDLLDIKSVVKEVK